MGRDNWKHSGATLSSFWKTPSDQYSRKSRHPQGRKSLDTFWPFPSWDQFNFFSGWSPSQSWKETKELISIDPSSIYWFRKIHDREYRVKKGVVDGFNDYFKVVNSQRRDFYSIRTSNWTSKWESPIGPLWLPIISDETGDPLRKFPNCNYVASVTGWDILWLVSDFSADQLEAKIFEYLRINRYQNPAEIFRVEEQIYLVDFTVTWIVSPPRTILPDDWETSSQSWLFRQTS